MELAGPPRRVLLGPDRPRPPARPSRWPKFRVYATPAAVPALLGLILGNATYLIDTRGQSGLVATLLSAWAVLPILVALRRPLLAWRLVYPLTFVGVIGAGPRESWPWPPVQIFAFLVVLCLLFGSLGVAALGFAAAYEWGCRTGLIQTQCPAMPGGRPAARTDIPA